MILSSWRPRLRSLLLVSILIGTLAGVLNGYAAYAVCSDKETKQGTCYTFGCYNHQCEYYGPSCGHGPAC
jgi:hypothetical protein